MTEEIKAKLEERKKKLTEKFTSIPYAFDAGAQTLEEILLEASGEIAGPGQQISDVRHRLKRIRESGIDLKLGEMDCAFLLGKIDQLQPIIQAQKHRIEVLSEVIFEGDKNWKKADEESAAKDAEIERLKAGWKFADQSVGQLHAEWHRELEKQLQPKDKQIELLHRDLKSRIPLSEVRKLVEILEGLLDDSDFWHARKALQEFYDKFPEVKEKI